MRLKLLPEPKRIRALQGSFDLPSKPVLGIPASAWYNTAWELLDVWPDAAVRASAPGLQDTVRFAEADLPRDAYTLKIGTRGIELSAGSQAGAFYGAQTLRQIAAQCGASLPCLRIDDAPDFEDRGVYYDVARGRVPNLESLLLLADALAHFKINHLQLYIEHTFAFRGHPKIGRGASPLSAEDILELDDFCRRRHIELVPSLASFGHLATVLRHPEYHHLAEDRAEGRYEDPEADIPQWQKLRGWTVSPAVPDVYPFLDSLFAEFLPLFSSKRFNVCCDETWDLGLGQSYKMCQAKGKGRVYLGHILKLRKLSRKYGKSILFWGDIIRHYPELIGDIPADVTVLDWGYGAHHPFARIADFKKAGVPFFACPGTSSWVSLFPRLHEAAENIAGFAAAGKKNGAQGLLNTDWGDGGHYNFMEYSWHGFLYGAEQGWNVKANRDDFTSRFSARFLGIESPPLDRAITRFGDIVQPGVEGYYQSIWQHLFFAAPGDPVLGHTQPLTASTSANGKLSAKTIRLNAAYGAAALKKLAPVRRELAAAARRKNTDPLGILPYWVFAADTVAHAARKLSILGPGGRNTAAARRRLGREMADLRTQFETLWKARNRTSEIRVTLKRYDRVLKAL